jgi:RNA polymerase sigma factor (TIGR02999 family)
MQRPLTSADRGDRDDRAAVDSLFTMLYAELRRLAAYELSRQTAPVGLGVTTLLHEAYLVIADRTGVVFPDHARFMTYAARVMRGLIVDHVRSRLAQKRGGGLHQTTLAADVMPRVPNPQILERLSDALDELATHAPALAEVVDLNFFCGLSFAEIAALRGVSARTVYRDWKRSRAYLHRAIGHERPVKCVQNGRACVLR